MSTSRRTTAAAVAGIAAFAMIATGCASTPAGEDEKITLTIATFNDFGYSQELLDEYKAVNPNVTIVHNKAATSNDARTNYFTKLGAGSGLADIEAVEIDWFAELLQFSDKLYDLSSDEVEGRWLDWKAEAATDADGRLIAYGTDIGPEAICYRADLFEAAGLPTDRDEVAALLEGDWDHYYEVGEQFTANSDAAWFDGAGAIMQGVLNQEEESLESRDGEVIATTNPAVKDAYDSVLVASEGLSAGLQQWTPDWEAGFASGAFATTLCPSWFLGNIEGMAPDVTSWDIANVFPNGGGNWGGSYLTVPDQGDHKDEAKALAAWLTAPEQQLKAFVKTGNFPSQVDLQTADELLEVTRPYFNDAPSGATFADRAVAVTVAPYKGAKYFPVMNELQNALVRADVTKAQSAEESWEQFIKDVAALG